MWFEIGREDLDQHLDVSELNFKKPDSDRPALLLIEVSPLLGDNLA